MTEERPKWFARREIAPFTLGDAEVESIIERATHAVVSWVTKDNEPVQAVMTYVVIDGLITVTSTTNRAKYHSWKRNPATSFCIWEPDSIGRQITLRGQIEIVQDDDLLRRFVEAFLIKVMPGIELTEDLVNGELERFAAPDRQMMKLHVDKVLSHDLPGLLRAERDGIDVWS